jgi:hypothetical protein
MYPLHYFSFLESLKDFREYKKIVKSLLYPKVISRSSLNNPSDARRRFASADFLEPSKTYSSYHYDNKKITINNLKVGRCV